jgi:prepilin-type N-terminal cleavage/methylation domain-containing protein
MLKAASRKTGYTIVETIVSLTIIGILAACVVTSLLGKTESIQASRSGSESVANSERVVVEPSATLHSASDNLTADPEDIQTKAAKASCRMEYCIIQTAMDLMMVQGEIQNVNPTSATSDMSSFPTGNPLYPRYVREATSQYHYRCDSRGEVTQVEEY